MKCLAQWFSHKRARELGLFFCMKPSFYSLRGIAKGLKYEMMVFGSKMQLRNEGTV